MYATFYETFMEYENNSAQAVTDAVGEMKWSDFSARLNDRQFNVQVKQIMRPEAWQHYGLDACIHFERVSNKVLKVVIQPVGLKGAHGWESPATLQFVAQTLATRVLFAQGCFLYRAALPAQEMSSETVCTLYFQVLDSEMDPLPELAQTDAVSAWSEPQACIPARPDLGRDLLRDGFAW